MPVKTHIVRVDSNNRIEIPKTICDTLGITENVVLKIKSDCSGYGFTVQVAPAYETVKTIQELREEINRLQEENRKLKGTK